MFNKKYLLIAFVLTCLSTTSNAKKLSLINSCVELINIYDSKNSTNLFAAQTTSLSESLRAGYCLGVIEQYERSTSYGCRSDWYERAKLIARESLKNPPLPENKLLELSCEI